MSGFSYGKSEEFIGTAPGCTIGLLIANVDPNLRESLKVPPEFSSVGILSTRVGASTQIVSVDDAVKSTNTQLIGFELARDTMGYGGPGVTLLVASESVFDAKRAVELSLKGVEDRAKGLYVNEVAHLEVQISASAGPVLNHIFGAPLNKAFAFQASGPCGIGMVASDALFKAANVDLIWHGSPNYNTAYQNDYISVISGEYSAVRSASDAFKEKALSLMANLGSEPKPLLEFMQQK